jgi:hypothetical protein
MRCDLRVLASRSVDPRSIAPIYTPTNWADTTTHHPQAIYHGYLQLLSSPSLTFDRIPLAAATFPPLSLPG